MSVPSFFSAIIFAWLFGYVLSDLTRTVPFIAKAYKQPYVNFATKVCSFCTRVEVAFKERPISEIINPSGEMKEKEKLLMF